MYIFFECGWMLDALTKVFSWRRWTEDLHLWYQFGSTNIYASKKFRAPWHLAIFFSCFFIFFRLYNIYLIRCFFSIMILSQFLFAFLRFVVTCPSCSGVCGSGEVLFCHRCLCRVDQNSFDVIDVGGQLTWICFRRFRNLLPKSSEIRKTSNPQIYSSTLHVLFFFGLLQI